LNYDVRLLQKLTSPKGKQPAQGADLLRLWAATVDYWRDMSIGPTVIAQAAESMRKIRNSARFCLGNLGDELVQEGDRVPREKMGLVGFLRCAGSILLRIAGGAICHA